ncbi:GNAT family N-acetyltransferase [Hypericibacter sp.]|uniref:GNAT family N-acetyltransferase n=1 Tax=Hypericibacter sp. TaxID=2705401 RepID=UPI003D6D73E2
MSFTIRPARPDDKAALLLLFQEFSAYLKSIDPEPSPEDDWAGPAEMERCIALSFEADPVVATLIVEQEGRPIGYLAWHMGIFEIYKALFVAGLFVSEKARGSGIGRALMDEARRLATERGASHVAWMVWRQNPEATAFYRRLGAETYDDNFQMTWRLA